MTRSSGGSVNCGCGWTTIWGDCWAGSYTKANEPLDAVADCQISEYTPGVRFGRSSNSEVGSPLERKGPTGTDSWAVVNRLTVVWSGVAGASKVRRTVWFTDALVTTSLDVSSARVSAWAEPVKV